MGANRDDNSGGTDAGAVYTYLRAGDSWDLESKLLASDGAGSDNFGRAVGVFRNTVRHGVWDCLCRADVLLVCVFSW